MGHSQSRPSGHGSPHTVEHSFPPGSNPGFTYTPLASPRSFRILRLARSMREKSGRWEDIELCGSIVEASLDYVPEYFALSYTWGDPSPADRIVIDGRVLRITQNCADALRRMLKGKFSRMLWVDSICINQGKDPEALQERARQVGFMDEIYSKATQVNVHLGPGDAKSDVAIDAVKRLCAAYLPAKLAQQSGIGQEMTRQRYERVADEVMTISPEFPYGKLHGLFRLPWFQRTWVIQEVALARKVTFYCGDHLLAFDSLVIAADFTRLPYSKADGVAHHWKFYLDPQHTVAEFIRRRGQGEDMHHIVGIIKLLSVTVGRDATRPEDKIHGLYGCAKRLGLNWPIPDYTKSVAEVYTEVTTACLNETGTLDVLVMFAEGAAAAEFELPSWVPNFSTSTAVASSAGPRTWYTPTRENKWISGRSQCRWSILPGGRRLKVLGRRLDQIATVSEPWNVDASTTLLGGASENSGQIFESLIDCVPSWVVVVLQRDQRDDHGRSAADGHMAMQDLARLLANGRPKCAGPYTQILEDLRGLINCASDPQGAVRSVMRIYEHITHMMWKSVFRTSTKNYVGVGSSSCSPGDLVVIFHGMSVPCVIRPCPEGFTFVRAAFVDGIMDGEFWSAGSDADDEWFVLI